jgi:hypothetical protein
VFYVVIAGIKMVKVRVVQTPGSYRIPPPKKQSRWGDRTSQNNVSLYK